MKDLIRQILKEQVKASEFCIPVKGWDGKLSKSQDFTACRNYKGKKCGRKHKAIDFAVPSGSEVYAPQSGKVTASYITGDGCGGMIIIDHGDGIKTKYCHLKRRDVTSQDEVVKGEIIGLVGGDAKDIGRGNSVSAHLHYQVRKNGTPIDPVSNGYVSNEVCGETIITQKRVDPDIVRELQDYLVIAGYLYDVDYKYGILDTDTINAIKELQKEHNLTPDGEINKETVDALLKDVAESKSDN